MSAACAIHAVCAGNAVCAVRAVFIHGHRNPARMAAMSRFCMNYSESRVRWSGGYFGLRALFGTMTLPGFTAPTRSRAMAFTSFSAEKIFCLRFAMFTLMPGGYASTASATREASSSKVTIS